MSPPGYSPFTHYLNSVQAAIKAEQSRIIECGIIEGRIIYIVSLNKDNNKISELRTILQRESQNS